MANHTGPVPEWLNSEYVQKILTNSLQLPDLKIKSMDISPGSKVGDNYCCQVFRITTVYLSKGKETKLSLIAKYMVITKLMDSAGGGLPFFEVEAAFYEILSPKIEKVTGSENTIGPNVYFIDREKNIIFMEDITVNGFKLQGRDSLLNIEQCNLAIDAIATLHGTSYYILKENPNLKQVFHKYFWSSERNEAIDSMFKNAETGIINNIDKYGLSESQQQKLLNIFEVLRRDSLKVSFNFYLEQIFINSVTGL